MRGPVDGSGAFRVTRLASQSNPRIAMSFLSPLRTGLLPVALFFSLALPTTAQFQTELLITGLDDPVFVASPPDGTGRLFVLERGTSTVRVFPEDGSGSGTVFLDLSGVVSPQAGNDGLLGLAFHPNYSSNRRLFLYYTTAPTVGTRNVFIGEFEADPNNPDLGLSTTAVRVFEAAAVEVDHLGGTLAFGQDGYLYAAIGDGDSNTATVGISQDPTSHHGKVLRFDVDVPFPHVVPTNPFLSDPTALDQIWAVGLRNPFGFSFDDLTGDMWIGDVGQATEEEIDVVPAGDGGWDFEWDYMEGNVSTGNPTTPYSLATRVGPTYTFPNGTNGAYFVIGGHVLRNTSLFWLEGRYLFADGGQLTLSSFDPVSPSMTVVDHSADVGLDAINGPITSLSRICRDGNGELLLVQSEEPVSFTGAISRVTAAPVGTPLNGMPAQLPNSSGSVATISASGSTSITTNALRFEGENLPANVFGFLVMSDAPAVPGVIPNGSFGYIYLDLTQTVQRVQDSVAPTGNAGRIAYNFDLQMPPNMVPIAAGQSWTCQWIFRDADPSGGSPGFHYSEALQLTLTQ